MAKQLNSTVHVHGHGVFGPGDKLPPEVRKLLADNPRVWEGEDDDSGEIPAEVAETHPGPSETADAGDVVEAAVEAAQEQRDAEHAAAVEAAQPVDDQEQPTARSTRARPPRS